MIYSQKVLLLTTDIEEIKEKGEKEVDEIKK